MTKETRASDRESGFSSVDSQDPMRKGSIPACTTNDSGSESQLVGALLMGKIPPEQSRSGLEMTVQTSLLTENRSDSISKKTNILSITKYQVTSRLIRRLLALTILLALQILSWLLLSYLRKQLSRAKLAKLFRYAFNTALATLGGGVRC